jgi:Fe-S-cluster-containing dehydrogenase component
LTIPDYNKTLINYLTQNLAVMGINRRNFFKVISAAGVSLALGEQLNASNVNEGQEEPYGILYDSFMCGGCQTCEYTCAEIHGLPTPDEEPQVGIERKTDHTRRTVVNLFDTSEGQVAVKSQCMHCAEPACVAACLTQAMYKTKEGPVIWREDKCMGCRFCMVSCPFDIPKFEYNSPNPKIVKCDMCYDRIREGKKPACVEVCPAEAMVFGKRSELLKEAQNRFHDNADWYNTDYIYGLDEAGGTGFMYIAPVPFDELDFDMKIQKSSYPELTKGFLYSVPSIFVLWPTLLLGIHEATKNNDKSKTEENE